jgi:hypothetical protein
VFDIDEGARGDVGDLSVAMNFLMPPKAAFRRVRLPLSREKPSLWEGFIMKVARGDIGEKGSFEMAFTFAF